VWDWKTAKLSMTQWLPWWMRQWITNYLLDLFNPGQ
jgi:hypothetical protein